jgi:hypothetical protein
MTVMHLNVAARRKFATTQSLQDFDARRHWAHIRAGGGIALMVHHHLVGM